MKINKKFLIVPALFILIIGNAQTKVVLPQNVLKDDSLAVSSIALYPESVRKHILEASTHPEVLVKMESLQESTSLKFKSALENYSRETQINIWNLSRYPNLVNEITEGGKKTKDKLKEIASTYPPEIYNTVVESGQKDFEILQKINDLQKDSEKEFAKLIASYPEKTKKSYQELVKYPEVVKILTDGMRMTVVLGDAYKNDSTAVNKFFDSLGIAYAKQNAENFEDWKDGLKKNPEAEKEMEEAAKKFASDEGYKEDELVINDPQIVVNYVCYPYPYWMGYPWWYAYPSWYPYPYWYDWGFYWTPTGIVYIGFPSSYFTYWYFYNHHHHYYYNHFTDYCLGYHYGHRKSRTEFNHNIDHWVSENEKTLPKGYFKEPANRANRIKEFGKFSIEYNATVKKDRNSSLSKEEFLQNNPSSYPNLHPRVATPKTEKQKPVYDDPQKPYDPVYPQPTRTQPKIKIPKKPDPVKPRIEPKPRYEQPKITPKNLPKKKGNR